jgi:hypothetical protein
LRGASSACRSSGIEGVLVAPAVTIRKPGAATSMLKLMVPRVRRVANPESGMRPNGWNKGKLT